MISDVYAFDDSREHYTLTIHNAEHQEQAYQFYEKYLTHKISVGYDVWDFKDAPDKASYKLWARCQVCRMRQVDSSEYLENRIIHYGIWVWDLLNVSVFRFPYFEPWQGKVTIDGINVTLEE